MGASRNPGGNFAGDACAVFAMALDYGDSKAKAKKIKRTGTEERSVLNRPFAP